MNGNNKSKAELKAALTEGVHRIVVDNFDELDRLEAVATELETDVSVFIRVAPGIECHTHDYIKTGQNDSKFGFGLWDVPKALERLVAKQDDSTSRVTLVGLQAHIGSQIFELQAYQDLARTMLNMLYNIRKEYGVTLTELDLGGGLGIAYTHQDDPQPTTLMLSKLCQELVAYSQELDFPLPKLLVEPGRSLMACAGMTLYQVGGRKEVPDGPIFISVDGGMGDNIRPALYQAEYSAVVINKFDQEPTETVRLVGKYCESGDILLRAFKTPRLEPGDQVVHCLVLVPITKLWHRPTTESLVPQRSWLKTANQHCSSAVKPPMTYSFAINFRPGSNPYSSIWRLGNPQGNPLH